MHVNGTAAGTRHQPGLVSPVTSGEDGWLGNDDWDQPLTLQLRLPVSAEEMAAALYYGERQLSPDDLATDEDVWGFAALAIVQGGLTAIQRRADDILVAETRGRLANPAWLATCRRRVAEVTGSPATGRAAALSSPAPATARAGAPPPNTAAFPRPRAPQTDTAPPEPGTRAEGLTQVRALTEIASPCRAGN